MTSDTVDYMMSQPDGANYVVLYQMLCLKTINTEGRLSRQIGDVIIPYDVDKIQRDCKWFSIDTIRVALNLFKAFGLVYEDTDGVLVMADHHNLVGSETDYADQKRRQFANKASKKLPAPIVYPYRLGNCTVVSGEQLVDEDGKPHFVDEKRYGGNGKTVLANANCTCQMCGSKSNVVIHHNNGYSNDIQDLVVLCKKCHGKVEAGVEIFHSNVHSNVHTDIRDKEIRDKEIREKKKDKPIRHKYGEYGNVLLSDEDLEKLKTEFPSDWEMRIEKLSSYIESKGAKYKNHLATIRNWARREAEVKPGEMSEEEKRRRVEEYLNG